MQILTMTGATPKGIPQPKIWPRRHYDVERPHKTLDTTNQQSSVVPGFMGPPMVEFVAIFVGRCLGVDLKAHVNMFIKHCYNAIFHNPAYIISQSHVISTACY